MYKKKDVFTLFFILFSLSINAQKVEISMHSDPEIAALNQPIQIIVKVQDRPDAVVLPELTDFIVVAPFGAPMVYSEMRGITDDVEKIEISTYTALVVPTSTGKFKVDGVSVLNGKKLMKTNSITIEVENRKVSWEDSTAVAQKFTGFRGNNKAYTPPKTAVNYNKPTSNTGVGGNSTSINSFGRGVDAMEIIPESETINAKVGEEFTVVFNVYREAEVVQFSEAVEISAPMEVDGITVLEGPNKRLHSKSNGFRKYTEGTVEYVCIAYTAGEFIIPEIEMTHNGKTYSSAAVTITIQ
ncbi:MAG TPA: BatD family protein [Chitinophagales bacterium]|nr:BatD family protein [Chitinophagales bacterium]